MIFGGEVNSSERAYLLNMSALSGIFHKHLNSGIAQTEKARKQYKTDVNYLLSAVDLSVIENLSKDVAIQSFYRVCSDLNIPINKINKDILKVVESEEKEHTAIVKKEVLTQLTRDSVFGVLKLKQYAFTFNTLKETTNFNTLSADTSAKQTVGEIKFVYTDRLGRKFKSEKFIRTLLGLHFRVVSNESYIKTATMNGIRIFKVVSDDPDAKYNDLLFSVGKKTEHKDFYEINETVFHPNSSYYIKAHS